MKSKNRLNKIFGAQIVKIFFVVYVHGKGGTAEEVEHFKKFFVGSEIVSFDYKSENVWNFKEEFLKFISGKNLEKIILIANSIGTYFSMNALSGKKIYCAIFISLIVNFEKIIENIEPFSKKRTEKSN